MNPKVKTLVGFLIVGTIVIVGFCIWSSKKITTEQCNLWKITFDLDKIDNRGSLDYEFCIPYKEQYLQEIKKIDPDIECYHGPSGRIGCTDAEYLCIGNTGHKDFRSILCKLSTLDYVDRIDQTFWE